jgi:Kae1-associated kinase Bud32
MKQKLIEQGAEAKIFLKNKTLNNQGDHNKIILKKRTPKLYRHPALDKKIRTRRTRSEAKILIRALYAKINVPKLTSTEIFNLEMEYLDGEKLSKTLNNYTEKKQLKIMEKLGNQTENLHENNIIHGDLTTSNIILVKTKVFLIDFGLSFISTKIEDKAVDIYLIKQALEAKHFQNHEKLFFHFLKGYIPKEKGKILERLNAVEKRGRYKH